MDYITSNKFFRYSEFVVSKDFSELAAKIQLSQKDEDKIKLQVQMCLDPWRKAHPDTWVKVLSGLRSPELNAAVGGSSDSDHLYGCAADIVAKGMTAEQVFSSILNMRLPYRQLILYQKQNFVHWSWNIPSREYKQQILFK